MPGKRRRYRLTLPNKRKSTAAQSSSQSKPQQNFFEIDKILRKASLVSTGGEIKYLVSWPNTWEPEKNLGQCEELLQNFHMGSMGLIRQSNDMENDDTEVFSSEWVVERILEKRTVNGKVDYYLKWANSWVSAKCINPDKIKEFEEETKKDKKTDANNNQNKQLPNLKRRRDDELQLENHRKKNKMQLDQNSNKNPPRKMIELDLIQPTEERTLKRIVAMSASGGGQFTFLLAFETGEYGLMKRDAANLKYPQHVITFYSKHIRFD